MKGKVSLSSCKELFFKGSKAFGLSCLAFHPMEFVYHTR